MIETDLYELLGVSRNATDEELKRAYRRKARQLHPDANPGDAQTEERFKEVSVAYEVLRDPERRQRYDQFGPAGVFGPAAGGSAGGFGGDPFAGGLGDLFEAFFGAAGTSRAGHGRRSGPVPGPDAELVLDLSFRDAVFGAKREVAVSTPVRCDACQGSGARPGTGAVRCPDCGGLGELRRVRQSILGQVVTAVPCGRCHGSGEVIADPCPDCRGEGRRVVDRTLVVEVPAGVDDGSTLRLAGHGPAGVRGGPNGALFVHLRVAPDPDFERVDTDLHTTVHVAMTQAALGASLEVPTLDEPRTVPITAGTQSGTVVTLKGLGVPRLRGRGRGDLHVHVVVDVPTELDDAQRALLAELAVARGEVVADGREGHGEGLFSKLRSALG